MSRILKNIPLRTLGFAATLLFCITWGNLGAKDFYVSPEGNDGNPGTLEQPFRTIEKARNRVRQLIKAGLAEDVSVYLRGGVYTIEHTVVFGLQDAREENYTVTYQAYGEEEPVISSGKSIPDWKLLTGEIQGLPETAKGNIWVAELPEGLNGFRTLFDGEKRLTRARSHEFRMLQNTEIRMADSRNVYYNKDRVYLRMVPFTDEIKDWENLQDIEIFFNPVPWNLNFIQIE